MLYHYNLPNRAMSSWEPHLFIFVFQHLASLAVCRSLVSVWYISLKPTTGTEKKRDKELSYAVNMDFNIYQFRVKVANSLLSAQHPSFPNKMTLFSSHVILGCLPLTTASDPSCVQKSVKELDIKLNYIWLEPFFEMFHLATGWRGSFFLLYIKLEACHLLPCPLCGESICETAEDSQEERQDASRNRIKASIRSRFAMHILFLCRVQDGFCSEKNFFFSFFAPLWSFSRPIWSQSYPMLYAVSAWSILHLWEVIFQEWRDLCVHGEDWEGKEKKEKLHIYSYKDLGLPLGWNAI